MDRREIIVWLFLCGTLAVISVLACGDLGPTLGRCCRPEQPCVVTSREECLGDGAVFDSGNMSCDGCPGFLPCCTSDGCVMRTPSDCANEGGTILSPDAVGCSTESCRAPVGACCLSGRECASRLTLAECEQLAGLWVGDRTECEACFSEGACGFADGVCLELPVEECADYSGDFQGPGTACPDSGSCLLEDGTCIQMSRSGCATALGLAPDAETERFIPGVPCPTGACRFAVANGPCRVLTRHSCIVASGLYQGDGSACSVGACATDDGCEVVTFLQCAGMAGTYLGDASTCPGTGACCVDNDCRMLTFAECAAAEGGYQGDGVECDPDLCQVIPTGACCSPGGCAELSPAACGLVEGGEYQGDGVTCESEPCRQAPPMGACCLFDGGCVNGPPSDICLAWKEGVACEDDPSPCLGACCLFETGECETMSGAECMADPREGVFYGPNFSCGDPPCPPPDMGACFLSGGGCIRTTRNTCIAPDEFLGPGTVCPPGRGGVADGGGGGIEGASLGCARSCMAEVSIFLASCRAQGTGIDACAPAANRIFQDCLSNCAPGCRKDCMTASSVKLTLCLAFGTPLETCLSTAQPDFAACLSGCPADCETDCLDAAATQVSDCLLGGGDPIECGRTADALIEGCISACLEPPTVMTPQLAGDCNQDGAVNVADVTCVVDLLFRGFNLLDGSAPEMPCATSGGNLALLDVSANEVIDVADIVALASFLFGGGAVPRGGAECQGLDEALGCPRNAACQ